MQVQEHGNLYISGKMGLYKQVVFIYRWSLEQVSLYLHLGVFWYEQGDQEDRCK